MENQKHTLVEINAFYEMCKTLAETGSDKVIWNPYWPVLRCELFELDAIETSPKQIKDLSDRVMERYSYLSGKHGRGK